MKVLDKIIIDNDEYTCIQILKIEQKMIYKVYNAKTDKKIFVSENQEDYQMITDKELLRRIKKMTTPKTDVIINMEGI